MVNEDTRSVANEFASEADAPQEAPFGQLVDGEEIVATLDGDDGGRFFLTTARVIHVERGTNPHRWSEAVLEAVAGVELTSRPKDRSSLGWAILGFLGALGIWQVSTNEIVGVVGGVVIGLIAAALAVDYLFFDPGLLLVFHAASGSVSGTVRDQDAPAARELAQRFNALRVVGQRRSKPRPRLPLYPSG